MNFQEAVQNISEKLGPMPNEDLIHVATCLHAQSEFAQLSLGAKEYAAKKLGFRSYAAMQQSMLDLLDRGAEATRHGMDGKGYERTVNRLQWNAIFAWQGGIR